MLEFARAMYVPIHHDGVVDRRTNRWHVQHVAVLHRRRCRGGVQIDIKNDSLVRVADTIDRGEPALPPQDSSRQQGG